MLPYTRFDYNSLLRFSIVNIVFMSWTYEYQIYYALDGNWGHNFVRR